MPNSKKHITQLVPDEIVINKIYLIRGTKVMLDKDLAAMYKIETFRLNEAVKRNISRFPRDFMFQLTKKEFENLISQIAISSWGGTRKLPYAFTEQGVAMLSGVINSPKAIAMNIAIMRAFVEIRKITINNKNIAAQIELLKTKIGEHDVQLNQIYDAIENLLGDKVEEKIDTKKKRIGFRPDE